MMTREIRSTLLPNLLNTLQNCPYCTAKVRPPQCKITPIAVQNQTLQSAPPLLDPEARTRDAHPQNPPGFSQPGTEDWQWYGTILEGVRCPSIRGLCELFIGQAMPPGEDWDPVVTLELVNDVARRMLAQIDATSEN